MPLPKAVQDIGDAAEQQAIDSGIKPGSKPAVVAEPAAAPVERIDPENHEERYKRYKASTDETIYELRQNLAANQATLSQIQQQYQELLQQQASAPAPAPAEPPVSADPKKDDEAAFKAWHDNLSQKARDEYTEDYLRDLHYFLQTMQGKEVAASPDNLHSLEAKVDKIAQFQEKTAAELYEEALDKAYPKDGWINKTKEPKWGEFVSRQVSPIDTRTWGQIVKAGNETHDATSVIWVLSQYDEYLSDLEAKKAPAPADPREQLLTPEGGAGGNAVDSINAQADTYTVSQVNKFYQDRTKGLFTDEEFKVIEESILKAQTAGKIVQG